MSSDLMMPSIVGQPMIADPLRTVLQERAVEVVAETTSTSPESPARRKRAKVLTAEDLKRNEADGQMRLPLSDQPPAPAEAEPTAVQTAERVAPEQTAAPEQPAPAAPARSEQTAAPTKPSKSKTREPEIVPDGKYANMFRVRRPDGSLSDMVNRTLAKQMFIELGGRAS